MTVEELKQNLAALIQKYRQADRSQAEADVRANYIDWLFYYLGWDVWAEDPNRATRYQREGYIRGSGYVDVGLEITGEPVLMLEAKRFDALPHSAERRSYDRTPDEKQLFRYAHRGKKIPYCILTNFERLHVFNADHERLILAFDEPTEYLDHLSELLRLSPERVKTGSLAAWERQLEIKDIDEAFLSSLQDWRKLLANAIYQHNLNNPVLQTDGELDFRKLMEAVQRILDRLILIRYADDREVLLTYDIIDNMLGNYRKKGSYARSNDLMEELVDFSHRMDEHHNTTMFQPGHICEQVTVPNEVLERIMAEMNNISFRKFTSDILGSTYETYLGAKLVLRNGDIKSEVREDIRKAGGIYYTPSMIVRYIVDNTLGSLLNELQTKQGLHAIEAAKEIKVLDPACGSGSFLIYAYRVLADFYRQINEAVENERAKLVTSVGAPDMFQRLELFKQLPEPLLDYPHHILEKQLYGVDIDPEAAEIAAVNLTMQAFADARRVKLPLILNENVKVGNSLIPGTEEELRSWFGDSWQERKPFNWEQEFRDIMAQGGFDVVIGNPPYVDIKSLPRRDVDYIFSSYPLSKNRVNLFATFIEASLKLVKPSRFRFSMIVPTAFLTQDSYRELRRYVVNSYHVASLARLPNESFGAHPGDVKVDTVIFVFRNRTSTEAPVEVIGYAGYDRIVKIDPSTAQVHREIAQSTWASSEDCIWAINTSDIDQAILHKCEQGSLPLEECAEFSLGITPYDRYKGHTREQIDSKIFHAEHAKDATYRRLLAGNDVLRYLIRWNGRTWVSYGPWLGAMREQRFFTEKRILVKQIIDWTSKRIWASITNEELYNTQNAFNILPRQGWSHEYLLGILNSRLMTFYHRKKFLDELKMRFQKILIKDCRRFPIAIVDFDNPNDKSRHDKMVEMVKVIMELQKKLAHTETQDAKEGLLQQITAIDEQIDELVYEAYGLTGEEIKVIESE